MAKLISRNVQNYFIALTVLVLCAALYRAASDHLLNIPEVAEVTPRPPTQRVELKEDLADLFPADAWQLGDCKRLLTGNGALLFQNWRQISEDQWKLEPLTIVVGRGLSDESSEAPIVLTAKEGAEVQFAQSLDMMGGSAPPIKMGRMIGDVVIERAGVTNPRDILNVTTRNVRIDKQKVWTTEKIKMQVGGAELRGSDLTIYLAASATSVAKAEVPSKILDRMDLVYLEELRIPLDEPTDETTSETVAPRRIGTMKSGKQNGEVSIRCNKGLVYDFALDRLALRDAITMVRTVRNQVVDRFDCDTLDLVLRSPADQTVQRRGPLDWIDRIRATGNPAVISLQSFDFQISAGEIDFDAVGGLLTAEGEQPIHIKRGLVQADLDNFEYQYDPDAPETIGVLDVRGRGAIVVDDPKIMLKALNWEEGFKLEPIGQATVAAVREKREQSKLRFRVDGQIRARLSDGGMAGAGSIEGILKPHYVDTPSKPAWGVAAKQAVLEPDETLERKLTLVPEVIHAIGEVSIDSNQLVAAMDRLSLFFEQSADFGKRLASSNTPNSVLRWPGASPSESQTQQPGTLASWVNQPTSGDGLRAPIARPRPRLSGNSVSALLLITPSGIEPKDLSIDGNVRVEHQVVAGESMLPLEMTGQTMRLLRSDVSQSSGQDHLQLGSGPESPARLKMGDGYFLGPVIRVWPSENVVQVSGGGELKVPSELLKTRETPQLAGANQNDTFRQRSPMERSGIQWTSAPLCRWGGAMQFDGQVALLTGGVQIDAEFISGESPWVSSMNGDEMQITLKTPVTLMDRTSMRGAELAQISLMQTGGRPVAVRAEQRTVDQTTESIHMMAASRLDLSPGDGGSVLGSGPGWYRGWMLMDEKNSLMSQSTVSQGMATTQQHASRVLQGVHLVFRETMRCDLKQETLAFTGGVRTGVSKLQSWDDVVDVAQMERLAIGEMTMDCQQLQFGVTPGTPADVRRIPGMPTPWEMIAEGGVVVRTNTEKQGLIEGTAARASYESRKSWLNIEGAPGQSAFFRQTWHDGRPGTQMRLPRMLLNLKTFDFQTVMQDVKINNVTLPQ